MENIENDEYPGPTTVTGEAIKNEIDHWIIERDIQQTRLAEINDIINKLEITKEVLKNLYRF